MWATPSKAAIDASAAVGASIYDCSCFGPGPVGAANSTSPGVPPGSIGFCLGTGGVAVNCRAHFCDITYALGGSGASLIGCSGENSNTVVRVGWGPSGETPACGCFITGLQTERSTVSIDLYNVQGCLISGCTFTGGGSVPSPLGPITTASWSSGTQLVTVTTKGNHNIPVGTQILVLNVNYPGFNSNYAPYFSQSGYPFILATVTSDHPNQFTYPGVKSDPGAWSGGEWTYPNKYGLRCRVVSDTAIIALESGNLVSLGSIDLDYDGAAHHKNNIFIAGHASYGWKLPSDTRQLAGWKFFNTTGGTLPGGIGAQNAIPIGMHFSDLPGQPGVPQPGPLEGQEYDITDGQKSGGGAATWGDRVIGGSSGHYKVRYGGTADPYWRRIG
jgi:hypothetical protein